MHLIALKSEPHWAPGGGMQQQKAAPCGGVATIHFISSIWVQDTPQEYFLPNMTAGLLQWPRRERLVAPSQFFLPLFSPFSFSRRHLPDQRAAGARGTLPGGMESTRTWSTPVLRGFVLWLFDNCIYSPKTSEPHLAPRGGMQQQLVAKCGGVAIMQFILSIWVQDTPRGPW